MANPDLTEVVTCLARYIAAFNSYDTARVAETYALPCLIVRPDGSLRALSSAAEIEQFFQPRLQQLRSEGCSDWRYSNLEVTALGSGSVLATMDWEPLRADRTAIGKWRQTYQLLRTENGLRFLVSTVHAS